MCVCQLVCSVDVYVWTIVHIFMQWRVLGLRHSMSSIWNVLDTASGMLLLVIGPLFVAVRLAYGRVGSDAAYG